MNPLHGVIWERDQRPAYLVSEQDCEEKIPKMVPDPIWLTCWLDEYTRHSVVDTEL